MVHLRINEREPNPNPYVNFISVLPTRDLEAQEAARQLLRALAAQVKPVMKQHGFVVNSLEEYEYNSVFAGRNWNHGETIVDSNVTYFQELVLRSSTGSMLSISWLMGTLCHELAHIKHGNHGPAFQALWHQLQEEVRVLQNRGYYGDGYWSSGTRLDDSARITSQGIEIGELPEYVCGGAHSRARPVSRKLRKPAQRASKKRKAGSRVHSSAFQSAGKALNEDLEGESKSHGVGFRKKAGSKRAREERALAAERRIQSLRGEASSSKHPTPPVDEDDSPSEDEIRDPETDYDRRRTLLEVIEENELDALRASALDQANRDSPLSSGHFPKEGGDSDLGGSTAFGPGTFNDPVPGFGSESQTKSRSGDESTSNKRRKVSQSKLFFTAHAPTPSTETTRVENPSWDCMVCTFTNEPNHLACSVCATPRGESTWVGSEQSS